MYICFDLDDTLLKRTGVDRISEYTINVLNKVKELGHIIMINTARGLKDTQKYIDLIKPHYSILNAGALVVDEQCNTIYERMMPEEAVSGIIDKLMELKLCFSIHTRDEFLTNVPNGYGQQFDFSNGFKKAAYKIVPKNIKEGIALELKKRYDIEFTIYLSGVWSRFNHKDASKLNGLKYVINDVLKGNMENVVSFGDDYGDLSMLLGSGIGVAMENSVPLVYEKCYYHTVSCDEDGVAKFLVKHLNLQM